MAQRRDSHEYLIGSVFLKLPSTTPIRIQNFRSSGPDVLPSEQLMHGRAGEIHGIKDDEVASAIEMTFETDNGNRMAGLLEIDWRKKGLVHIGAIADSSSSEIAFHGSEEQLVGHDSPVFVVTKLLYGTVDLRVEEESLCLSPVSA
jgi:hypothetical protein